MCARSGVCLAPSTWLRAVYGAPEIGFASRHSFFPRWNLDAEKRPILLAAENVGITDAPARRLPVDRELDREGRVELDVVANPFGWDAVEPAHGVARQDLAAPHEVVGLAVLEDHVEGDPVDARVLAADRLRERNQRHGEGRGFGHRQTPASIMRRGNSSRGSLTRMVWLSRPAIGGACRHDLVERKGDPAGGA